MEPKEKLEVKQEMDKCVSCETETSYSINTPVDLRDYYIEGASQLCQKCYEKIYGK
jgi:hypothetical protein